MEPDSQFDTRNTTPRTKTLRIFISSPGDANAERDKAKQVIAQLQKCLVPSRTVQPNQ